MNDTMRTDSVRLEAENARLRKGIEFIRDTVSRVLAEEDDGKLFIAMDKEAI